MIEARNQPLFSRNVPQGKKTMKWLLVIAMLLLSALTMESPSPSKMVDITQSHYSGQTAEALFTSLFGCTVTQVGVYSVDGPIQKIGQPIAESTVFVFIDQIDSCTGDILLHADNKDMEPFPCHRPSSGSIKNSPRRR
jgi:hypothetical protein